MVYLRSFEITENTGKYPLNLPVLQERISFCEPVTILCGRNGCGKTTLLDLIAEIAQAVRILSAIPGADILYYDDDTLVRTRYEDLPDVKFLDMFMKRRGQLFDV